MGGCGENDWSKLQRDTVSHNKQNMFIFLKQHKIQGVNIVVMKTKKLGQVFTNQEIEEKIKMHKPSALFLVHGETITGYLQPLEGLGDICHK